MPDALARVKRELGDDAVILHTKTHQRRSLLGAAPRCVVEVTAAASVDDVPARFKTDRRNARSQRTPSDSDSLAVASRVEPPAHLEPDSLFDVYRRLIEADVAHEIAGQLMENLERELPIELRSDPSAVGQVLSKLLVKMLPPVCEIDPTAKAQATVVAFVGPTGVGKTTTLAKLATDFAVRRNLSVGCVTLDTKKLGAVEQIRAYTNIIDVPLRVIKNPSELASVASEWSDFDVILIDTPGLSQNDSAGLIALANQLASIDIDETHLVLPATTGGRVMRDVVDRFSTVGADRLILTKQDEAIGVAVVLNAVSQTQIRFSYTTTGQDVPDGINVQVREALADSIAQQVVMVE